MNASFLVTPVPPFRLDLTVWTLRRRADNVVDRWDGDAYRRILVLGNHPVELGVTQVSSPDAPRLRVTLAGARLTRALQTDATAALERLLGIRIDLAPFYRLAADDPKLGPLAAQFRGMKPPRLASVFETLANAIACQQITLTQGIRLLNRLAEAYGPRFGAAWGFPSAQALAEQSPEALRELGYSYQKADYLIGAARQIVAGELDLPGLARMDNAAAAARLRELRGVGRWTAEYVLLRGLGRLDVFPGDDVGAWHNLTHWLRLRKPLDYARVERIVRRWQPYAGLIYFHLLLDRIDAAGYLSARSGLTRF